MPDLIRHPVPFWIPACAGMTALTYLIAGVIVKNPSPESKALVCPYKELFLQECDPKNSGITKKLERRM